MSVSCLQTARPYQVEGIGNYETIPGWSLPPAGQIQNNIISSEPPSKGVFISRRKR